MYKGLSKIVNGLVFVFLDLNLDMDGFKLDIVPDFIGYLLIAFSCKLLYEETGKKGLKMAYYTAGLLVVFELINLYLPFAPGFQYEHMLRVSVLLIHVVGYTFFNESMDVDGYRKDLGRMSSLSLLAFSLLAVFRQFEEVQLYEIFMLIVGISVLMTGFTWFISLNKLTRSFKPSE